MKRLIIVMMVAAMLILPHLARAATTPALASINIEQIPIELAVYNNLTFGTVIPGTESGTVTVSTSGGTAVRTTDGKASFLASSSFGLALIQVYGQPSLTYSVTLPSSDVTITKSGGGSMTVNTFTYSTESGSATIAEDGIDYINVGASLRVGASQTSGLYTGTFTVSVDYQ